MFKELGAFIDEVGSFTGRVGRVLKKSCFNKDGKDDDGVVGIIDPDLDVESVIDDITTIKDDDTDKLIDVHIE